MKKLLIKIKYYMSLLLASVHDLSLMNVFIASTQERCVLARRTAVNK